MHRGGEGVIIADDGGGRGSHDRGEGQQKRRSVSGFSQSVCDDGKELMDPFASNGEDDDNKERGEHSKNEGEYAEKEFFISGRSPKQTPCSPTCPTIITPPRENAG